MDVTPAGHRRRVPALQVLLRVRRRAPARSRRRRSRGRAGRGRERRRAPDRRTGRGLPVLVDHRRQRDDDEAARELPARVATVPGATVEGARRSGPYPRRDRGDPPLRGLDPGHGPHAHARCRAARPGRCRKATRCCCCSARATATNGSGTRADEYDIDRAWPTHHLAFGHGIHVCLGAALARLEMRVSLEEFLARHPGYEIDESGLERVHSGNVRGYSRMPIRP